MRRLLKRSVNIWFFIGLILLIGIGYGSYQQSVNYIAADHWEKHSYRVLELINQLQSNYYYSEGQHRGYLFTRQQEYLNNYLKLMRMIKSEIVQYKLLTSDNQEQNARADTLRTLLDQRIDFLREVTTINNKKGLAATIQALISTESVNLFRQIHQTLLAMQGQESKLLFLRHQASSNKLYVTSLFIIFGSVLSIILILSGLIFVNRKINQLVQAGNELFHSRQLLKKLAYFDSLTELPNRISVTNLLTSIMTEAEADKFIFLMLIGIDRFKTINDSFGYEVGDQLLKLVANRLSQLGLDKKMIARVGADEFMIVMPYAQSKEVIHHAAKKILASMLDPFIAFDHSIYLSVSIGISLYPENGTEAYSLMKNAEIAMYRAKELGRKNYQLCTSELTIKTEQQAALDHLLRHALDNDQFSVAYQPKISLKDEKIIGFEALARWKKDEGVAVSPDLFISLAENNGVILPLGEWVLRQVCLTAIHWHQNGWPLYNMSVNLSPRQLNSKSFVLMVKKILEETGFDPQFLEFEITESMLIENSSVNKNNLRDLKALGVKISIDDFGIGYSSLSYLRMLDIDKIKIDKSFMTEMLNPEKNEESIVNAIIIMAHSLGIEVVAEGVELKAHVDFLKQHHCDEAQGFYYYSPLPEHEVENALKTEQRKNHTN